MLFIDTFDFSKFAASAPRLGSQEIRYSDALAYIIFLWPASGAIILEAMSNTRCNVISSSTDIIQLCCLTTFDAFLFARD